MAEAPEELLLESPGYDDEARARPAPVGDAAAARRSGGWGDLDQHTHNTHTHTHTHALMLFEIDASVLSCGGWACTIVIVLTLPLFDLVQLYVPL